MMSLASGQKSTMPSFMGYVIGESSTTTTELASSNRSLLPVFGHLRTSVTSMAYLHLCRQNRPRHRVIMTQLIHADLIAHAIVVEVHKSAWCFCCEVEKPKAVAHEVGQGVGHPQNRADLRPCLAIQAVVKMGFVRTVSEVAVDLDIHGLLLKWNAFDLFGRIRLDTYHDDRLASVFHFDADKAVFLLQGDKTSVVTVFHAAYFNLCGRGTHRATGTLGKCVPSLEDIAVYSSSGQPQMSPQFANRPVAVVGIVVPLPRQRQRFAGITIKFVGGYDIAKSFFFAVNIERYGGLTADAQHRPVVLPLDRHQPGTTPDRSIVLEQNRIPLAIRCVYQTALSDTLVMKDYLAFIWAGDIVGTIAEIGHDVTNYTIGTRVSVYPLVACGNCQLCQEYKPNLCLNWQFFGVHLNGGYGEYVAVPAANLIQLPDSISFEDAVALPVAGLTAFHALTTVGNLLPGQSFFTWRGAGGLGTMAIQIAKYLGATVFATGSSPERLDLMKVLGADHVFNRDRDDVANKIRKIAPAGIDLAIDFVGPATFQTSFDLLKKGGQMILCGIITGRETNLSLHMTYLKHLSIKGIYLGTKLELTELVNLVDQGKIKTSIGKVMALKDAAVAQQLLAQESVPGKIALKIN